MMSEYRNDPTIDFLLDEGSKDYANRYNQHIHAMTAEGLSAKSDIAWELTIRDQRLAELEAKNKRLVEASEEILKATIAETVEKAAFVDEMCKALGVTLEELVNDDSVKAGIREKDDE